MHANLISLHSTVIFFLRFYIASEVAAALSLRDSYDLRFDDGLDS